MTLLPNNRFKEIRKNLKLTQVELAQKLKVSQGTITDIERGRIGVSKKVAKKLKEVFGIETGEIYGNTEKNSNEKKQGANTGFEQGVTWKDWLDEGRFRVSMEYVRRLRKDLKKENRDLYAIVENYLKLANFQDFIDEFIPEYLSEVRKIMIGRVDSKDKEIGYTEFKSQSISSLKNFTFLKDHLQKIADAIVNFYHEFEPYDSKNVIENHFDTSEKG